MEKMSSEVGSLNLGEMNQASKDTALEVMLRSLEASAEVASRKVNPYDESVPDKVLDEGDRFGYTKLAKRSAETLQEAGIRTANKSSFLNGVLLTYKECGQLLHAYGELRKAAITLAAYAYNADLDAESAKVSTSAMITSMLLTVGKRMEPKSPADPEPNAALDAQEGRDP